jgi:hypothetical protein
MKVTNLIAFVLFLASFNFIYGQEKSEIIQQRIEFLAEQNENEDIDLTATMDALNYYLNHPINLNKTTEDELNELGILTQFQVQDLLLHLKKNGKLITIYELQTLKYWDQSTIQLILPFVTVDEKIDQVNLNLKEILKYGHLEMYNRYQFIPEKKQGYIDSISPGNYQGNANHYYTRLRYSYRTNLSFGITADKDPGEPFFQGVNKQGFDFYSAHAYYRGGKYLKGIVIGDYHIGLGQGLLIWTNYAFGKTADAANIKKTANSFKPYTSADENRFLRGFAIDLGFKNFTWTNFGSIKKMDATVQTDSTTNFSFYSSIQATGLHRTTTEIERKNTAIEKIVGSSLSYKNRNFKIGLNTIYQGYDKIYSKDFQYYNQFDFRGKEIINISTDYNWVFKNLNFFGELAHNSFSNGIAQLHGILIAIDSRASFSVVYRNYAKNYQSFYSNAFADATKTQNEKAIYVGSKIKLNSNWLVNSYIDLFSSPWLKYQVDAPSSGHDLFSQITYKPSKKLEIYGRIREQNHQKNSRYSDGSISSLDNNIQHNIRLNLIYQVAENITLKSRIEYVSLAGKLKTLETGTLMTQDLLYKPKQHPFDLIFRYALFQTDSYDTRIYSYESNAQNVFSIPAYYDKGSKFYVLIRTTFLRHFDLWIRYGKTVYINQNEIGSGNESILGNLKSDFTFQLRLKL